MATTAGQAWRAVYVLLGSGALTERFRPVAGWDGHGRALVVDELDGRLAPAVDLPRFLRLEPDDDRIVAVLPGGGWGVTWTTHSGEQLREPVLAWTVGERGHVRPLIVGEDGLVETTDDMAATTAGAVFTPPAGSDCVPPRD